MLNLKTLIGKGASRECYIHPFNKDKCVKVSINNKDEKLLQRELFYYPHIKSVLDDYVVEYDNKLIETNKGKGLVCQLLRDDDGAISKPLVCYQPDAEILYELNFFTYKLIEHDLFFYDFNLKNFVIQNVNEHKKLKYIDLKSFENNKSWCFLKLERLISPLARIIMVRRLKRLYAQLKLPFPYI